MRGIDREWSEQREDVPEEMIFKPRLLLLRHLRDFGEHDAVSGQHLAKLAPALLLVARKRADGVADTRELFGWREPVWALEGEAGAQLSLEAGNADHEKLIEIVGRNRQEPNTFEQRMGFVGRLFEHAPVELQP